MFDRLNVLFSWIGLPSGRGRTQGIASAIATPIFGLFGVLLVAAGWHGIWANGWSYQRIAALVMFVIGALLVTLVAARVINFMRQR